MKDCKGISGIQNCQGMSHPTTLGLPQGFDMTVFINLRCHFDSMDRHEVMGGDLSQGFDMTGEFVNFLEKVLLKTKCIAKPSNFTN